MGFRCPAVAVAVNNTCIAENKTIQLNRQTKNLPAIQVIKMSLSLNTIGRMLIALALLLLLILISFPLIRRAVAPIFKLG